MQTPLTFKFFSVLIVSVILAGCALTPQTAPPEKISVFANPTHWGAFSRTAYGITGDITLTDTKLTFANQASLNLEPIEHDAQTGQTLFRVTTKLNPELLNGNFMCGGKPIDYIVVQVSGDVPGQSDLQLMAYYYPEQLRLSDLPLKDQNDLNRMMCALYTYVGLDDKPARAS
jgi:hypothetical protein